MSYSIDLATHGRELKAAYDAIVSSDPDVNWAVFNYGAGQSNALSLRAKGAGDLEEFIEEFDDGKVQYGFARLDYNNIPKYVLVGWVGEGVPERTKGYFNAHFSSVARFFKGYHVSITARSSDDLTVPIIMDKVHNSAGSKYSGIKGSGSVPLRPTYKPQAVGAREEDWGDAEKTDDNTFSKVQPAYTPHKVNIHAIRSSGRDKPEPVTSSYQPVGKVDIAALRASAKGNKFSDDRPTKVESSYKPIGKVDIAAIRAQAKANPNFKETIESTPVRTPVNAKDNDNEPVLSVKDRMRNFGGNSPSSAAAAPQVDEDEDDDSPKSVQDRMAVFSNSGRLTELPKPKVSNTVSSRFNPGANARGTAPALPSSGFGESRAVSGFTNFGSEGGKTPAQIWAEKHAKNSPSSQSTPAPPPAPARNEPEPQPDNEEEEDDYEQPDISSLRNKFSSANIESAPRAPAPAPASRPAEPENNTSFSDITSRFAKQATPTPPPAPAREQSPEPIRIANPVGRGAEPEEEPELEPTRRNVPPAPSAVSHNNSAIAAASQAVAAAVGSNTAAPPSSAGKTKSAPSAVAEFEYEAAEEGEISFKEDEVITNIEFLDPDWWQGTNSSGETGLFPSNHVQIKEDEEEEAEQVAAPAAATPAAAAPASESNGTEAVAEFEYVADEEGEVGFDEGEVITNIEFVDEDWWQGTNAKGETGLFPANHVVLRE